MLRVLYLNGCLFGCKTHVSYLFYFDIGLLTFAKQTSTRPGWFVPALASASREHSRNEPARPDFVDAVWLVPANLWQPPRGQCGLGRLGPSLRQS
ncbi:hypothetical protein MPC4_170035 [Methylocella tundrae]|uniref:Uncharacterized protein n=1 Tax=Methylocella tundrae TaxID=227605 RepID=A0A8B6M3Y6_METTU|nr:hypothetical protein MPC4_170035 [Methylocella tundrae]